MSKCVVYMRGGLGDMYPFLTQLPSFLKEYELKMSDLDIYIDSAYFQRPDIPIYKFNLHSMKEMLKCFGIFNYTTIPADSTSAWDLKFHCQMCHIFGAETHKIFEHIEPESSKFMFWRQDKTIEYINNKIKDNNARYFVDVAIPEHIYIWDLKFKKKPIKMNYQEREMDYTVPEEEKKFIDNILKNKHMLIQLGLRGFAENVNDANILINKLTSEGYKVILSGFDIGYIKNDNVVDFTNNNLSFAGYLYLSENAKEAIMYSSFFSFHRMYVGENITYSYWAKHLGDWHNYLWESCLNNPNNRFINSDEHSILEVV